MALAQDLHRVRHWTCAQRMSERRHDLGLTQHDVVHRLETLGVCASNRTLSAMEHGQGVDVGRLPEIATALDCTVTYLLGLTDSPASWLPDRERSPVARQVATSWILGPDIPDRA
ncbi:MAG TPA: helix-turn-helix transcriptional regulator [Jatrophihabitantaceae bacterium]|jgi:transcriptional regulator with XRE-family HTH domain|nr:helix-turn-helix transcriptional regulator [Jatrophihabitantaceae bacterium]